jgi:glutamine synthetase
MLDRGKFTMANDLVYVIPAGAYSKAALLKLLKSHPEIRFVSLIGIDLAGNDTDEKIPIEIFTSDMDDFIAGATQTDGSSVVLHGIATLNDAKVDMVCDTSVNWVVDYNYEYPDEETGNPVGTLRIPCFLVHNGIRVDSRAILFNAANYVKSEIKGLLTKYTISGLENVKPDDVDEVILTSATELEFWVKTPDITAEIEKLSASQVMQEQYWGRTKGEVRTALEESLLLLEKYGLEPEMGHKEVGGVKAKVDPTGHFTSIMEQLEIDWKYSHALQCADNELLARTVIKEVFRRNGLDLTFQAKPIPGVAGSGEHTHVGMAVKLKSGKVVNLFSPANPKENYLSAVGYGAIMGLLKNYEVVNPFISATNDSLNRLKPGFEAPVCIVTSLGGTYEEPSRNRTILAGLVRDVNKPLATRFEVRSPNPYTNTYIALTCFYMSMLDGIKAAVTAGKTMVQLEAELSKEAGTPSFYLETNRAYRSEHDVFDDYSADERDRLFSKPPATVWENMENLKKYPEKVEVLKAGGIFRQAYIDGFVSGALLRWKTELLNKIIPDNLETVRDCVKLHSAENGTDVDDANWAQINALRIALAKDSSAKKSLFSVVREALTDADYATASTKQVEMAAKMNELRALYTNYKKNII